MRLWIGPEGQVLDLDEMDLPHSVAVARDPAGFGLSAEPIERHWYEFDSGEVDFDYDTLIVMAEDRGWVRVARDADGGAFAVSAASERNARKALAVLAQRWAKPTAILLEIERISGRRVERSHSILDEAYVLLFIDKGRLPARSGPAFLSEVSEPTLLEALEGQAFSGLSP